MSLHWRYDTIKFQRNSKNSPLDNSNMSRRQSNWSKVKILFGFVHFQLCAFGLVAFVYDQKTKKFWLPQKRRILTIIMIIFIAFSFPISGYVVCSGSPFLWLRKISEITVFGVGVGYISVISMLVSCCFRSRKIVNTLNKGLLLLLDFQRITNSKELFTLRSLIVTSGKTLITSVRLIMHIWHSTQLSHNESKIVQIAWCILVFDFNILHIISNWTTLIVTVQSQLYARYGEHFKLLLQEVAQNADVWTSNCNNKRPYVTHLYDMHKRMNIYAQLLKRMFWISEEINKHFGVLITADLAFNYINATTDLYYLYFVYVSPQTTVEGFKPFFLIRKYIMVFAQIFGPILTFFVVNATMSYAREIASDFEKFMVLKKQDRLEKTVSRFL